MTWGRQLTGSSIISVEQLTKKFGALTAINDTNLEIEPGVFGLIGPNGAGKTTLLRILLDLARPDSGHAQILGLDSKTESLEIRRRIGVLHEQPSFPEAVSVRDYLQDVCGLYNSNRTPESLLKLVDLEYAADRQIGQLSAGMRQRVGIALAFAGNPEIVFLDEPTANLDVGSREQILDLIFELHQKSGVSFVLISHILSELERACTHVAFMQSGRIIESGKINEVISRLTKRSYRIKCSESHLLIDRIREIEGTTSARILGPASISLVTDSDYNDVRSKVEQIAASLGVTIYSLEQAATLEDAYREVIR
ncbi:MAG: ABC transporter ATP-binding protein [Candidatus Thorarchaeota archaeon]|nr:MAG: ABC transporter ATP-binding protein [Candidatus Thorarchaeota archaeon]